MVMKKLEVGNGDKLVISHIGKSIIPSLKYKSLLYKNVPHVPEISKNSLTI